MNKRFLGLAFSAVLLASCVTPVRAASEFTEGLEAFNAGNFGTAQTHFEQAIKQNPKKAEFHYYLAVTYAQLNEHSKAYKEYQACSNLHPTGAMQSNCEQAIDHYKGLATHRDQAREAQAAAEQTKAALDEAAAASLKSSLEKQVEHEKQQQLQAAESESKRLRDEGQRSAELIKARQTHDNTFSQEQWQNMAARSRRYFGLQQQAENARNQELENQARSAQEVYSHEAESMQKAAAERAAAIDKVKENLSSQAKGTANGIRLKPENSNLYVRTYGK